MDESLTFDCAGRVVTRAPLTAAQVAQRGEDATEQITRKQIREIEDTAQDEVLAKLAAVIEVEPDELRKALRVGGTRRGTP